VGLLRGLSLGAKPAHVPDIGVSVDVASREHGRRLGRASPRHTENRPAECARPGRSGGDPGRAHRQVIRILPALDRTEVPPLDGMTVLENDRIVVDDRVGGY
jgi:hypothetical protein